MQEAKSLIRDLDLQAHPEGGYFREVYRSREIISKTALDVGYSGDRNICTSIYFLLTSDTFSAFHRIRQDEIWHYYSGSAVRVYMIDEQGKYGYLDIGPDLSAGQTFQAVIPAGSWFGAKVKDPDSYVLVGCTVSPGFDFVDFELAKREELIQKYPQHKEIIDQLTRV